jgi:DNA-binding cell septation regulator SpoVG
MLADIRLTIATMIEELLHRVLGRKNDTIKLAHVIDGQQGMFPDAKMTDRTVRGIAHYIERTFNGSGQRKMKDYYDWLISIYQDVKDPVTPKS